MGTSNFFLEGVVEDFLFNRVKKESSKDCYLYYMLKLGVHKKPNRTEKKNWLVLKFDYLYLFWV